MAGVPTALQGGTVLNLVDELQAVDGNKAPVFRSVAREVARIVERGGVASIAAKQCLLATAMEAGVDEQTARSLIDTIVPGPSEYEATVPLESIADIAYDNWWENPAQSWPQPLTRVDYLGGHPRAPSAHQGVTIAFVPTGLSARASAATELGPLEIDVPWAQVTSFTVEGATQLQRRATVVRYLAVGLLALAWKKAENSAFLVVSTADGDYVFGRKETVHELRASLSVLLTTTRPAQSEAPGSVTVADRLRQLKELHNEGIVDDAEFAETKARLLSEL